MSEATYTYLKDEIHYNELYDKFTIEECKRWEDKKGLEDLPSIKDEDPKKLKIKIDFTKNVVIPVALYAIKGERYAKKAETIRQWMDRDRALDEKVANAVEPKGIRCLTCSSPMSCISRDLHSDNNKDRVLFMFECPQKGHKRRAYWEGGEEWEPRPTLCSKCKTATNSTNVRNGDLITTTYICPGCGNKETDTMDLSIKEKEIDPNFEADRKKYCLSEKEGGDYITWMANTKHLLSVVKDREENKQAYEAVAKIKKLTVIELEKLLAPALEKEGYIHLQLANPEIDKNVVVPFTAQDSKAGRESRTSEYDLKRILKKILEDTNWRLMTDGVNYRLGVLSGRLKGYESEEDLIKLVS